jgi:uncharacterized membrane protein YhfC
LNNTLTNISYIVAIIIEIGLPVLLAVYFWKKYRVSWSIFFLGMALFLVSLVRIPLNNYINSIIFLNLRGETAYIAVFLFASVTAGVFEEGARVLAFGAIIKQRSYEKGLMYGIGHGGGGESIIFVGVTVLSNFLIFKFFPHILPADVLEQFENMAWYLPMVGAMERIFAIIIQISLSILVVQAFIKRKYYFIIIAVIYHALIDFVAVYVNFKSGVLITEILVFVFALVSIAIIFLLKPKKYLPGK